MHGASNTELVSGILGYEEVIEVDVAYKRGPGYLHNYIAERPNQRQVVRIVTVDGISGELSHALRTEKGMEFIKLDCNDCNGNPVSYWTLPKESFLFDEAREGLSAGGHRNRH